MVQDLNAALAGAKNGSLDDILSVARAIIAEDCPLAPSEQVGCVNALFDAMDVLIAYPVSTKTTSVLNTCIHAWTLLGFNFFKRRTRLLERLCDVVLLFRNYIPRVLSALVDDKGRQKMDDSDAEWMLRCIWACARLQTFSNGGKEEHLLGDIETFKLAARVWLVEWSPEGNAMASTVLSLCISSPHIPSVQWLFDQNVPKREYLLGTAASMLGFTADDIMCLALSRFRRAKVMDMGAFFGILSFLFGSFKNFDAPDIKAYYQAFERHCGVRVIVNSLQKILDKWDFDINAPDASRIEDADVYVLSRCLGTLVLVFNNYPTFSVTLVKQALNQGIIRILACCSDRCVFSKLDEPGRRNIRYIIKNILGGSIMIRSILLVAQRSIKTYQPSMEPLGYRRSAECFLSEVFPSVASSRVKDVWEAFFRRLNHQASSFHIISHERDAIKFDCGNPACSVRNTKSRMFRCAGCYITLFCSQSCQTLAWREHRAECTRYRQYYVSSGISARDGDYLTIYAQEDARRRLSIAFRESAEPFKLDGSAAINVVYEEGEQKVLFADNTYDRDAPGVPQTMMVEEGAEMELQVALRISYCWGREGREYLASMVLDRSVMEGKWCSCCRFHVTESNVDREAGCTKTDGERCPVHVNLYQTLRH